MGFFDRFSPSIPVAALLIFAVTGPSLWSQTETEQNKENDPGQYVGLTLTDLFQRFGAPRSVYASRGPEEWQDDVVFVYDQGDFYIYKDRVWQAGLKEAMGIRTGDTRAVVSLVLGTRAENRENSIFCSLDTGAWPMMLRFDFDKDDKVLAIFIYRTDI